MLTRSTGRRQRRHTSQLLAASFAQLSLPWLAPAQLRWHASRASISHTKILSAPRPHKLEQPSSHTPTRRLATAADQYTPRHETPYPPPGHLSPFKNPAQDRNVPWDFSLQGLSDLRPYSDPIVLNHTLRSPAPLIKVQNGIHGTKMDLLQHLHTSLRVGRADRAVAIIQRLHEQCLPNSPEILHAHTVYLGEQLRLLASYGRETSHARATLRLMQNWFEVEVRNHGTQPNAEILVIMIRAAVRSMDDKGRDRAIRRYSNLAKAIDADTYADVLESEEYDDNEFTIVGRATSELFEKQHATVEVEESSQAAFAPLTPGQPIPLKDVPEVLPMAQKGEGLMSIKRAMESVTSLPPLPPGASIEMQHDRAYQLQRQVEEESVEIALDRWRNTDEKLRKIGIHTALQSKPIGALMWQWYQALLDALEKELVECKRLLANPPIADHDRLHYGPYLETLPLYKIAATTILHTMAKITKGKSHDDDQYETDVKLNSLTTSLGSAIEEEVMLLAKKEKMREGIMPFDSGHKKRSRSRQAKQNNKRLAKKSRRHGDALLDSMSWPLSVRVKLGAMLVSRLIENAQLPVTRDHPRTKERITQMQPAFLHRTKYKHGRKVGVVTPNPALIVKLESEPVGDLIAKRMPMVVEPQPWSGWQKGGYLHSTDAILRLAPGDKSGKEYFLAAHNNGDVEQVYAGLTALGKVPWNVNHDVFKVQLEAWNSGEGIGGLAPLHPQLDVPPEPMASSDPGPRRKWLQEVRDLENKKNGLHSKRCFQNFQLEIARTLVNSKLYFPHNMDFRGRAYPIPPYLNHMGADNVRGLLTFAEGKELGHEGLRWLKIHLATVAGHDKASLEERVEFTQQHLDDIYDSVRNPLNGRRWWLKAEDGWQTLAACFELTKALDSPDPEKFVSCLPVSQDGTCNGLQHYAALGGDMAGAQQVNLEPGNRPADVYTAVADAVKAEVRKDAAQGNLVAQKLDGRITRKCVKQPVMTNVYGVTFYGAKEQVMRQLEALFPEVRRYDDINIEHMSHYVTTKIFKSLGTMFRGAQAIQHWLGQCADRISTCLTPEQITQLTAPEKPEEPKKKKKTIGRPRKKPKIGSADADASDLIASAGNHHSDLMSKSLAKPLFKSTVVWTTPLRLPVVQPYRTSKSRMIATTLQNLSLQEPQVWDPVSKRKQLQAFPPNFIHSLDATHMLLSVLKCTEQGMTFASIHDSFWTHARDVTRMNVVLRDAFVKMHSEDIIGRLREEFMTRYKGCMYLGSVLALSPVGLRITQWRREMKDAATGRSWELALEAERMRLLGSDNEDERERGKEMVTPGSIFATEGDEAAFAAPLEMAGQMLGEMPSGAPATGEEDGSTPTNLDIYDDNVADTEPTAHLDAKPVADSSEGVVSGSVLATDVDTLMAGAAAEHASSSLGGSTPLSPPPWAVKAQPPKRKLFVWLPMTFPAVPPKGRFDVTRLKESKYFFH